VAATALPRLGGIFFFSFVAQTTDSTINAVVILSVSWTSMHEIVNAEIPYYLRLY